MIHQRFFVAIVCEVWYNVRDWTERQIKIEGTGYGVVMSTDESKLFCGRIGQPKAAICPECSEVSIEFGGTVL